MSEHEIAITTEPRHRPAPECPYVFRARCSCGRFDSGVNAPKWVLLAIQGHWMESGLTGTKGLVTDLITGKQTAAL